MYLDVGASSHPPRLPWPERRSWLIRRFFVHGSRSFVPDSRSGRPGGRSSTPLQEAAKPNDVDSAKLLFGAVHR